MIIRAPRVLDQNLTEKARVTPSALSASITIDGLSSASMTLGDSDFVQLHDFVEVYRRDTSLGIFRVAAIGKQYGNSRDYRLSGGLCTLEDDVIVGQGKLTGTPQNVLATLLNAQTVKRWQLGRVEAAEKIKNPLEYDNSNLYDSVRSVLDMLPDHMIQTDQSAYPWTLHVVKKPAEVQSEARLSRNIAGVRIDVDDSNLCTRLYLDGTTRHWDADTQGTWGIISRNISRPSGLDDDVTDAEIEAYIEKEVAAHFEKNKNPLISIEIDGRDLSARTGEALDRFTAGYVCRVALPDYNTAVNERVITLSYHDLLYDPDAVSVQLSNRSNNNMASRMAGLIVQAQKLQKTTSINKDKLETVDKELALRATLDQFEYFENYWKHTMSEVEIRLDAVDTTISLKADRTEITALDVRVTSAEVIIDGMEAEIDLKVSKNGVISAINLTTEEARIQAAKIVLDGYVTTSKLSAELASINSSISTSVITSSLSAHNIACSVLEVTDAVYKPTLISYTDASGNAASMWVLANR